MMTSGCSVVGRLLGAGLLGLLAGCSTADADGSKKGVEYRPAAVTERLQAMAVQGDDIGLVRDFDMRGDSIFLLDGTGRIVVIERSDAGLRVVGHIGRPGRGPGELNQPGGIAVGGSDLMVADGTRIHFFSTGGDYLSSKQMNLPCPVALPRVAAADGLIFVFGSCHRRGQVTDTMKAILVWSADTTAWSVALETPRFTTDGSAGSIFGTSNLLTTGPEGVHVFGGGEFNCFSTIRPRAGIPQASEICPAVEKLYSADPPPGLEVKMRSARLAGLSMHWPESLPAYSDHFIAGDDVVLIRPFSADSVVLQLATPNGTDLAVAPLNGLLGCKKEGCVWLLEDQETPRLIVLSRNRLERMAKGVAE